MDSTSTVVMPGDNYDESRPGPISYFAYKAEGNLYFLWRHEMVQLV